MKKGLYIRQCSSRRVDQVLQIILLLASVCQSQSASFFALCSSGWTGEEEDDMTGGRTDGALNRQRSLGYIPYYIYNKSGRAYRRFSLSWWWMAFCFPACFWLPVSFFTMWLLWFSTVFFFLFSFSFICSATVHISVNDVNEYAPKFNQPSYVVDVDEGRPVDKILQVEANDADCSAKYGDICRYDILNKDQPFAIDNEGLRLDSTLFLYWI